MDDITILTDKNGGTAVLTTASPASHYGIPVLRIEANDVDGDFGPGDLLGNLPNVFPAANIVAAWGRAPERTDVEREVAALYLRQWPEGPQVDSPAAILGRKGRAVNSPAQQATARANGAKGGRPAKRETILAKLAAAGFVARLDGERVVVSIFGDVVHQAEYVKPCAEAVVLPLGAWCSLHNLTMRREGKDCYVY